MLGGPDLGGGGGGGKREYTLQIERALVSAVVETPKGSCANDLAMENMALFLQSSAQVILYWHIPTDGIFCLYWNILTDGMFCTGLSLLSEHFVLEYPY
jgi:hypothetical protein